MLRGLLPMELAGSLVQSVGPRLSRTGCFVAREVGRHIFGQSDEAKEVPVPEPEGPPPEPLAAGTDAGASRPEPPGGGDAPEGPATPSGAQEAARTESRARSVARNLAERMSVCREHLNEVLRLLAESGAAERVEGGPPVAAAAAAAAAGGAPEGSKFDPKDGPPSPAGCSKPAPARNPLGVEELTAIIALAREFWDLWRQKHAALTASERVYASLLADSRRTAGLAAELRAVQSLLRSQVGVEGGSEQQAARHEALASCWNTMELQAADAIEAFRDRVQNYPCGRTSPVTGFLCISRAPADVNVVVEEFESRVREESREAMMQAKEVAITPELVSLVSTLNRRLAFWESEIEENWASWSRHSTDFHDASQRVQEVWAQLRLGMYNILARVESLPPQPGVVPSLASSVPLWDLHGFQQQLQWGILHETFVEVAAVLALQGAWADFHSLRGDGVVIAEARDLFSAVLMCSDSLFDGGFVGSDAVRQRLGAHPDWNLVCTDSGTLRLQRQESSGSAGAEEASSIAWWSPQSWPNRGQLLPQPEPLASSSSDPGASTSETPVPEPILLGPAAEAAGDVVIGGGGAAAAAPPLQP